MISAIGFVLLALSCLTWMPVFAQDSSPDTFSIALTGKYPPFSFYSAEDELVGFDVDVSRQVAERIGMNLEIITTEWDGILAGLLAGRYDAIIGSMAITPERAEQVDFSMPYYVSGAQLFVHKDVYDVSTTLEIIGKGRIGTVLGTTYEQFLTKNYSDIEVVTYKSETDIYQDMQNKRLDGFVTDKLVGSFQIKQAGKPFIPAGPLLYKEQMGIPVKKDNEVLLTQINTALAGMRADGTFDELNKKWFGLEKGSVAESGAATGMPPGTVAKKLARGFAITLLVAFASLALGFALALPAGVILNRNRGIVCTILRAAVDFIRGTPVLIQLFFVYFSAPQIGVMLSPLQSAILTLSINAAAYMAEVIRSGLMAVDPGQKLAGRALGLTPFQTFRYVIWPQAFRVAIPPLMNSAVALMKDTALIMVISVAEVISEVQSIISVTYDPMKYYFIVAVMFFVFTFPLMKLANRIEQKIKEKGFKNA